MGDHDMPQHHYTLATRPETPREADTRTCPHCEGSGRIPLSRSTQGILNALRSRRIATPAPAIAAAMGLTNQRADGCLHELAALGLVRRLPGRTAYGYEWEAIRE